MVTHDVMTEPTEILTVTNKALEKGFLK